MNEQNLLPDLHQYQQWEQKILTQNQPLFPVPMAARAAGMDYPTLVRRVLELAAND